jgi:hypothetical protein
MGGCPAEGRYKQTGIRGLSGVSAVDAFVEQKISISEVDLARSQS